MASDPCMNIVCVCMYLQVHILIMHVHARVCAHTHTHTHTHTQNFIHDSACYKVLNHVLVSYYMIQFRGIQPFFSRG